MANQGDKRKDGNRFTSPKRKALTDETSILLSKVHDDAAGRPHSLGGTSNP